MALRRESDKRWLDAAAALDRARHACDEAYEHATSVQTMVNAFIDSIAQ